MKYTYLGGPMQGKAVPTTISVDNQALPCPSEMKESLEDLHGESKRNARGYLVSDIVRSNVAKLDLNWKVLSKADYNNLKSLLGTDMFKQVKYVGSGGEITRTMYKGALSAAPYRLLYEGSASSPTVNEIQFYTDISLSLIEK